MSTLTLTLILTHIYVCLILPLTIATNHHLPPPIITLHHLFPPITTYLHLFITQGKADPHHVETHRYPFAGQPNPLVKLAVAFLPPPVPQPPPAPASFCDIIII